LHCIRQSNRQPPEPANQSYAATCRAWLASDCRSPGIPVAAVGWTERAASYPIALRYSWIGPPSLTRALSTIRRAVRTRLLLTRGDRQCAEERQRMALRDFPRLPRGSLPERDCARIAPQSSCRRRRADVGFLRRATSLRPQYVTP